jgi:hypothetical protein
LHKIQNIISNLENVAKLINNATTCTDNAIRAAAEKELHAADKFLLVMSLLHILDQENNMFDNYDLKFQCATLLKAQLKQLGSNVHEPYHTHHYVAF